MTGRHINGDDIALWHLNIGDLVALQHEHEVDCLVGCLVGELAERAVVIDVREVAEDSYKWALYWEDVTNPSVTGVCVRHRESRVRRLAPAAKAAA